MVGVMDSAAWVTQFTVHRQSSKNILIMLTSRFASKVRLSPLNQSMVKHNFEVVLLRNRFQYLSGENTRLTSALHTCFRKRLRVRLR